MGNLIATLDFLIFRRYAAGAWAVGVGDDTQAGSSIRFSCTYFV
jgi:hypothetical protein